MSQETRLYVYHNIFLTREQRYALHNHVNIIVVGVSVPVWILSNETITNEREIFCNYYLINDHYKQHQVKVKKDGFEIYLPNRKGKSCELDQETWRKLNWKFPTILMDYYKKNCFPSIRSKNLLDFQDGGQQRLYFEYNHKIKVQNKQVFTSHFITIQDISVLKEQIYPVNLCKHQDQEQT